MDIVLPFVLLENRWLSEGEASRDPGTYVLSEFTTASDRRSRRNCGEKSWDAIGLCQIGVKCSQGVTRRISIEDCRVEIQCKSV